jgi:hypothetical protein
VPLSCNLGTLTSCNPLGHSRPVTGLLYLYQGGVVGTTPRLRAGHSEFRIPLRKMDFYQPQNVLSDTGVQPASSTRDNVVLSPVWGGGRSGRGVKFSTHLHLEVKNKWTHNSNLHTPHTVLYVIVTTIQFLKAYTSLHVTLSQNNFKYVILLQTETELKSYIFI